MYIHPNVIKNHHAEMQDQAARARLGRQALKPRLHWWSRRPVTGRSYLKPEVAKLTVSPEEEALVPTE